MLFLKACQPESYISGSESKMKAVIGINVDIEGVHPKKATIQANYYEAIARAGGTPVLIPPLNDEDITGLLARVDGVLFIGGGDYCPSLYGEEKHEAVELAHEERIEFDHRLLLRTLEHRELPLLGICAGCQILNIGLGGSLYQHIESDFPESRVEHATSNGWNDGFNIHKVILEKGSGLSRIYSKMEFDVPTSHHQAVKNPGKGLVVTASAEDGVIEAVELEGRGFVIGVQWHPERDYAGNRELFEAFVQAALVRKVS